MHTTAMTARKPRPLTGRMVLLYLVTFFGIIFAANIVMARLAVSTFSGVETESAYKAGLAFEKNVAAAHAQDARHWEVDAKMQRAGGTTRFIVTALDAQAQPLTGLTSEMTLEHPTDRRRDVALALKEVAPGRFEALDAVPPGQWDLVIAFKRGGETVFRSKSRVAL